MRAMVLESPRQPLREVDLPRPRPGPEQVLIQVHACGVCRTDLHVVDGELTEPKLPWCRDMRSSARSWRRASGSSASMSASAWAFPGWVSPAAPAATAKADAKTSATMPASPAISSTAATPSTPWPTSASLSSAGCLRDAQAAPLLCAGLIGYRSLVMAGEGHRLGLYGFGAAAHIIIQVARHQGREVYAFSRPGDLDGQQFARDLGAVWAGGSDTSPPEELDAAILFAPVGSLVPLALRAVAKGGVVVCAGIHMSDIPSFPVPSAVGRAARFVPLPT